MSSRWAPRSRSEESSRDSRPTTGSSRQNETTAANVSSNKDSRPSTVGRAGAKPTEINARTPNLSVYSIAFLVDGKHVVSGSDEGKIRCWRVGSGNLEEEPPLIDVGDPMHNIAVGPDAKRIVHGTRYGKILVWDIQTRCKIAGFNAHNEGVNVVDVSPDGTRITTGSSDKTVVVWSLEGGRLFGPLQHDGDVVAAKFSPDGKFIATATWERESVRVYGLGNHQPLLDLSIQVGSPFNQSLAWGDSSEQLFALSSDGTIHCLDPSKGTAPSSWRIHAAAKHKCRALACDGTFIAASSDSSVTLWSTRTREQLGFINYLHVIESVAISTNYDIVAAGTRKVTINRLCDVLPSPYRDSICLEQELKSMMATKPDPNHVINFLHARLTRYNETMAGLEHSIQELRNQLASQCAVKQEDDRLKETVGSSRADLYTQQATLNSEFGNTDGDVQGPRSERVISLCDARKKEDSIVTEVIYAYEKMLRCEMLYDRGRVHDASKYLLGIVDTANEILKANETTRDWFANFTSRCVSKLKATGDEALRVRKYDEALAAYDSILSLDSSDSNTVLEAWAEMMLNHRSVDGAWKAAGEFKIPKFRVYRQICDLLEGNDRIQEAITCFRQMQSELLEDMSMRHEQARWEPDFRTRCIKKLEALGDARMSSKDYSIAIGYYSEAISLDPTHISEILSKRSEARADVGSWEEALSDANKAIERDPSFYKGYERKHAALHGIGRYGEAFQAFQAMLQELATSSNPSIRQLHHQYHDVTSEIQGIVRETIREMPHVLIDTNNGRLLDKARQEAEFERLPTFNELRSSMTTRVDRLRIRNEVQNFYRYVMLSHTWQQEEPTFQLVEITPVFQLPASHENNKLRMFCMVARSHQFRWAWSDTCCVNQADKGVQQESIFAMFRWYRGSSLTVVHLLGVLSNSRGPGCLRRSVWNTRGWTYQEYVASKVIQFYTEDWKPYLGLNMFNHKESATILSEMERAMNFATPELAALCPALNKVREKLYLASGRQTTRDEDIAYSLFGIFDVSLPIMYGEGNQAVGRLLEHILTRSGDVTLLAWTGTSSSHHSYLPATLAVYNEIIPPHVPQFIDNARMDSIVTALRLPLPDLSLAITLYGQLEKLPLLTLVPGQLRLPCIAFRLTNPVCLSKPPHTHVFVYRMTAHILGDVQIKTADNLMGMKGLLIHPWICPLLDLDFDQAEPRFDSATRALRLIVRLRQRFGALLLAPVGRMKYKRVATDSLIMVQIPEETRLEELEQSIQIVDIQ